MRPKGRLTADQLSLFNAAVVSFERGHNTIAHKALTRLSNQLPDSADMALNLAMVTQAMGEYKEAAVHYQKAESNRVFKTVGTLKTENERYLAQGLTSVLAD